MPKIGMTIAPCAGKKLLDAPPLAWSQLVESHGQHDKHADDHAFVVVGRVLMILATPSMTTQEQHAEHRAGIMPTPPCKAAPADHGRGDRVQLVTAPERLRDWRVPAFGRRKAFRRGGRHGTDAIGQPLQTVGANAAQSRGRFVAAQGIEVTPATVRLISTTPPMTAS